MRLCHKDVMTTSYKHRSDVYTLGSVLVFIHLESCGLCADKIVARSLSELSTHGQGCPFVRSSHFIIFVTFKETFVNVQVQFFPFNQRMWVPTLGQ